MPDTTDIAMNAATISAMFSGLDPETLQWLKRDNETLMREALKKINVDINSNAELLCPEPSNILLSFKLCPMNKIRIIILGQDPYPNRDNAMGLSFSVYKGRRIPQSLMNIYKCLMHNKLITEIPAHGDLTEWAKQGILLLNAALTTRVGVSNAHKEIWSPFINKILADLNKSEKPIIFVFWGKDAATKSDIITGKHHHILTWGHPSPLSTYNKSDNPNNFMYCDSFTKINNILIDVPIDWKISPADCPSFLPEGLDGKRSFASAANPAADEIDILSMDSPANAVNIPPTSRSPTVNISSANTVNTQPTNSLVEEIDILSTNVQLPQAHGAVTSSANKPIANRRGSKWTTSDWDILNTMLKENKSNTEIAQALGRTEVSIVAAVNKIAKLPPLAADKVATDNTVDNAADKPAEDRHGSKWTTSDWDILNAMVKDNKSYAEIAQKLGRSERSVEMAITKKSSDPSPPNIVKSADDMNTNERVNIPDDVTIYVSTDGACKGNGTKNAVASWAFYLEAGETKICSNGLVGGDKSGIVDTNNRGELLAFIKAAEFITKHVPKTSERRNVVWIFDSMYSYNCLTEFAANWLTDRRKQYGKKNLDIILPGHLMIKDLIANYNIAFKHIHSHTANPKDGDADSIHCWALNKKADELCESLL